MNHHKIQRILTFTVSSSTSNVTPPKTLKHRKKIERRIAMLRKQIRTMDPGTGRWGEVEGGGGERWAFLLWSPAAKLWHRVALWALRDNRVKVLQWRGAAFVLRIDHTHE